MRSRHSAKKIHLGCGSRIVDGWHNVDLASGEERVDFCSRLPWPDHSFSDAVAQQVVEHLDLRDQLPLFLKEIRRILRPQGRAWFSCPDMEKFCHGYIHDRCKILYEARQRRHSLWWAEKLPVQHMLNEAFHQDGQHVNLFDYELLRHFIMNAGFSDVKLIAEADLIAAHPEFPSRHDDETALYVVAVV